MRRYLPILAYAFVVAMGAFGLWLIEHRAEQQNQAIAAEEEAREFSSCQRANESREVIRDIAVQVGVESAESIIEVASTASDSPPRPEVVEAYRAATERRMEAIASQLEPRDCEAEARQRARE